jgi:hypothetical protein
MATTLNMTLLLRRAEFADSCILQAGEPGYHTGTKEFKIGDGSTQWSNLPIANDSQIRDIVNAAITAHAAGYYTKSEINDLKTTLQNATSKVASDLSAEASARDNADTALGNRIDTKLDESAFNTWKGTHETDHAKTATEITTEITTAVNGEKALREAADTAINNKIGGSFDTTNTVAKAITDAETAAKSHADSKASTAETNAKNYADAQDSALAQTVAGNLANAVSALETKITNGNSTTLQSAKDYVDQEVSKEKSRAEGVESGLNTRLEKVEAFFEGAAEDEGEGETLKNALDTLKEIQDFATSEGTAAESMLASIAENAKDIEAVEGRMNKAESDITALTGAKLDKSTYEAYINGKSMSDKDLTDYADGKASAAQSAAITEATRLDGVLKSELQKEIDDDVKAAIDAEVTRSNKKAEDEADAAETAAKSYADSQDTALKANIEGISTDASSAKTIAGAKKYAEEKASEVQTNLNNHVNAYNTKIGALEEEDERIAGLVAEEVSDRKDEIERVEGLISTEKTRAEKAESAIRSEFDAADTATLNAAKTYADTVAANAVTNNIKAGNTDIVITRPESGEDKDKTVISHKVYGTGTYTKPDSVSDASFVTGVTVENGHVTGATVKSLAEALMAMEFIFDGGTSAN